MLTASVYGVLLTDAKNRDIADAYASDTRVIRLSGRDIDDVRRLLSLLAAPPASAERQAANDAPDTKQLVQRAQEILANRRRRIRFFGRAMFSEAAWEMLLLLYVSDSGPRHTVSKFAKLAGYSKSTAIRWIDYLAQHQLIVREPHPTDMRSAYVSLSSKGREALEAYLSETLPPHD